MGYVEFTPFRIKNKILLPTGEKGLESKTGVNILKNSLKNA
jgi:hypothetical protein